MTSQSGKSDTLCFSIRDLKFLISHSLLNQFFDGTLTSYAICDQSQKATMIISFDEKTKMIHLTPLIREIKEFEIPYDDLINTTSSSCISLPTSFDEISQKGDLPGIQKNIITVIESEQRWETPDYFPSRKFLTDAVRKKLSQKFGTDKTDDQLVFLRDLRDEELQKIILLEAKLGIKDPVHSRSLEQLEDMIDKRKILSAGLGELILEQMDTKEFEELYFFYLTLSKRYSGNENRTMYKISKLIGHRKENEKKYGGRKSLEELDEILRKEDFS